MTITISQRLLLLGTLAIMLAVPSFSQAASPDLTTLQNQYRMLMEQFESMKKRGMHSSSTASSTRPVKNASTTLDRTCMATAVATREDALVRSWEEFHEAIEGALTTRKTNLVAAWNLTDKDAQKDATKDAWNDWRTSKKTAHTELRSGRKYAWETFKNTAKTSCKVSTPGEESLERSSSDSISL